MANPPLNRSMVDAFVSAPPEAAPKPAPVAPRAERPGFKEREAMQKMTVNMPKDLYEELRVHMKLTDMPMSVVLVEGARRELARLRKQEG
jgi:hypothetical protein